MSTVIGIWMNECQTHTNKVKNIPAFEILQPVAFLSVLGQNIFLNWHFYSILMCFNHGLFYIDT